MLNFNNVIGHEDLVEFLRKSIKNNTISHSYIFNGQIGSGKKYLAKIFAMALQCDDYNDNPCESCQSCKKVLSDNHPDIIVLNHEKSDVIKIDEVRDQLVSTISIKPYLGKYKIYIIPDADKMNVAAQNAILKTIEEPPEYAVIILLTVNINKMLPTIVSRCVNLDFKVVKDSLVTEYLVNNLKVPEYEAKIDTSFANGSIGVAKEIALSEGFNEFKESGLNILKNISKMNISELTDWADTFDNNKDLLIQYFNLFQFWYRDVLLFKATKDIESLVFKDKYSIIREQANKFSYEQLNKILEAIEKAKFRLKANVNVNTVLELLFLTIREKRK